MARYSPTAVCTCLQKSIESLIDKEYLRRGEVRTEYEYLA